MKSANSQSGKLSSFLKSRRQLPHLVHSAWFAVAIACVFGSVTKAVPAPSGEIGGVTATTSQAALAATPSATPEIAVTAATLEVLTLDTRSNGNASGLKMSDDRLSQVLSPAPNPQGDPNSDRFPQSEPLPEPLPEETPEPPVELPVEPSPTPETSPETPAVPINIQKIEVTGNTILDQQINSIIQPFENRTVTLPELTNVADAITQLYLDRGFITSRAILADQEITDGIARITVIEGTLERIEVEGLQRLNSDYVRSRIRLGGGTPLSTSKLEDQLRLLRIDPLFENVEASLRAGTGVGQSILVVRVTEAQPFIANFSVDNYSPPSVGSERLGIFSGYRNLTGRGDEITAAYYRTTTGGADVFDFNYRVPLNAMNGSLQLRFAPTRNEVTQPPFDIFDISGESSLYEISYRQPLIRSPREEFALSVAFTVQNGQTFTFAGPTPFGFGPDAEGNSRTRVIKLGQDYVRRDASGAWALRSLLSLGLDIFDATDNAESDIPDGQFFSFLAQAQRVQRLNEDNLLIAQLDLQLSPDPLLPSQQFVIGGGQSVRGFRQNARAGDNGLRFSLEDRFTVQRDAAGNSVLQLAPFFDMGVIWNVEDNRNNQALQSQRFLAGVGLGLLWQPLPGLNVRLDYGYPLVDLEDRGENAQDDGFYFSVNYQL